MATRRKKSPAPEVQPTTTDLVPPPTAPIKSIPAATEEPGQPPQEAEGTPRRQWQPDPFPFMAISLGRDKDSPKMTLFRSNKLNQMAIRFDEKPEEQHRERLRADGWRWREAESVWTKQMDRERRATSQMEAERIFTEIGEAIRAERGLSGRTDVGS